jgi:hypothetical protein
MKVKKIIKAHNLKNKSFEISYDETQRCMILKILDKDGMYPCLWDDPDVGIRKIIKTSSGKVQMI